MEFSFHTEVARITHCADEAAFVHRIWYLVYNNEANGRNFHNGKYWTYDSVQALAKIFDFWTPKQLRRIVKNCVDLGLIETGQFSENSFDRRSWYTVTERVRAIYQDGQTHLPKQANASDGTGESIGPNGQMDAPGAANADAQSGKSDSPKRADQICPNGKMIKGAIIDLLEDQMEDGAASAPASASGTASQRKAKRKQPERQRYGEFGNVLLSAEEYDRLCSRWTGKQVRQAIEALSAYMASKGKRYANHYATLLNWLKRDCPQGASGSKLIEEDWV